MTENQTPQLTQRLKDKALELGFDAAGICAATPIDQWSRFQHWLEQGYAGEMTYLTDRSAAYSDPKYVLDGVESLVLLTMNYGTEAPKLPADGQGRVSRYAWGPRDYHDVIHERLKHLLAWLNHERPHSRNRGVVDTAPLFERQYAQLAGLGWLGKNTLLLNRSAGSLFFLAAVLTDQVLEPDPAFTTDHCGSCTKCLDACPTDAFPQPYVLDATRCISYLTIELRGDIPVEFRPHMDSWMFGCDVCQDVCPWNRKAPVSSQPEFFPVPDGNPVDLCEILRLDEAGFRQRYRHTPLWRSKRRGVLRNAAIVLGGQKHVAAVPDLIQGLNDVEPLVRAACAWALGQMQLPDADHALHDRLSRETDPSVRRELEKAAEKPSNRLPR